MTNPGAPTDQARLAEVDDILAGGGEMGARMRALDWSKTPFGRPETWSPSLRAVVRILLANRFPMLLWWGPDYSQLYNDAYRPVLGAKHPQYLGRPGPECWSEIWDVIGPLAETPFLGGPATWDEDILLVVRRHGFAEETHFTIAYSPVPDETVPSGIGGVLATVNEITRQVVQERRAVALRDLGARSSDPKSAEEACRIAADALAQHPKDVPFALLYLLDADRRTAHLAGAAGTEAGRPFSPPRVVLSATEDDRTAWPFGQVVRTERPLLVEHLAERFGAVPPGPWTDPPSRALVLPIPSSIQHRMAGVLVLGISAWLAYDDLYRSFCEIATAQVATAIANARAYEEERKRAEALAELDRAKTTFFSNVSHELRTPLTLLLGMIEDGLNDEAAPLAPAQRERQEVAHRNALRLLRMVNRLLDFSRIEAGRAQASYEATDLAAYTAELASTFRSACERAGLRLTIDCPPLPEPVYVDREMWEEVVFNLLSNAVKFTFAGEIQVSLRVTGGDVARGIEGDHVALRVRDTGTGIAPAELPRLFERFHRVQGAQARTHEGSGIGLALVQELARLHGGRIVAESTPGQGSTFTLTIPLGAGHLPADRIEAERPLASTALGPTPYLDEILSWLPAADEPSVEAVPLDVKEAGHPAAPAPSRAAPDAPAATGRRRILVADDNRDMRDYVVRLLRPHYAVDAVRDGEQALAAARANPPDLILSDIMMPVMDGFGLVSALRADPRTRDVPIILLSARAGEEARIEGLQAHVDDYIVKPFAARDLLVRIEGRLELARLRKEAMQHEQATRARLESLFSQAPAAISLLDGPEHVFTLANPKYVEMVGGRSVIGKPIREALPELAGQGIFELLDRVYATGEAYVGDELPVRIARGDGGELETVYFNFVYAPIRDAAGRVDSIFVHAYEITEQVQARRAAEEAAHARDEFLSIASHELRNPVAGIKGTAQLLRRMRRSGRLTDERLDQYVSSIEVGSNRLATLTEDLLDVSRLQQGVLPLRLRSTDLVALIRDVVARLPEPARRRVRLELADTIPPIVVDPDRVEQIVVNLLDNADKYAPGGDPIDVSLGEDADGLQLRVRDRGLGLPRGSSEQIFQPFGRAANAQAANIPGLGLGLYICRQIAGQHGGRLWAESNGEGHGTIFTLWLPVAPRAQEGPQGQDGPRAQEEPPDA
jgi:signal transduction histidine kinase/CheY-like chemotaxis protein